MRYVYLIVFAALIFSIHLIRPVTQPKWREADVAAMARNYYEEGMSLFYPRIDWRGEGPGFVESEFPFQSYLGAILYELFGPKEWLLRLISFVVTLGTCLLFFQLAKMFLERQAAFLASIFFVLHPYIFFLAHAIQPEAFMLFFYIGAILYFLKWLEKDSIKNYFLALFMTTAAILAKIPALHVGILFLLLSFNRFGLVAIFNLRLWLFATVSLGISFLWYWHARDLWFVYGNSLGISNEGYARLATTNWQEFLETYVKGNLITEIKKVWLGAGALLGVLGIYSFTRVKKLKPLLYWLITLIVFYFVTGGTTGEEWAHYYHVVSVPLASLAISQGFFILQERVKLVAYALLIVVLTFEIGVLSYRIFIKKYESLAYLSAKKMEPFLTNEGLLLVNGLRTHDFQGRMLAGNAAYYFLWLDRKGFTFHQDKETMEEITRMQQNGVRYFVVEKNYVKDNPNFYASLLKLYPVLVETEHAYLIDLKTPLNQFLQ